MTMLPSDLPAILDLSPVFICDIEGRVIAWSTGAERLYGWPRAEAVGKLCRDLLATEFPKPLDEITTEFERDGEWYGELRHRTRDGRVIDVVSQWALRRDADGAPLAVVVVNTDITERRRAETARMMLAAIVESSDDAIVVKDLNGIVTSWNRAAAAMFGYTAEEIIGKPIIILLPPDRSGEEAMILERLRRGERLHHFRTVRRRKDGTQFPTMLTIWPIRDEAGKIVGISELARDVTEQQKTETALQAARAELVHISRVNELGQMASTLAHEINQPLTAIANYATGARRLLAAGNQDGTLGALERIAQQAERARQIVQRLRQFMRKGETAQQVESLSQAIEEALALATIGARDHGLRTTLQLDPDASHAVIDKVQVQQVLFNLMRNAIEAMAETPRQELTVATRRRADGQIEVSIADTGPGLAPEVRARLFQPFVTTKPGGLGVGLSICRSIVEAHGGELTTEESPGGGTVFRFNLVAAEFQAP